MTLLTSENRRQLYDRADNNTLNEWATSAFWTTVLNGHFTEAEGFTVAPEQPPAEDLRKRVDIHVSCVNKQNNQRRNILYVEFKRASMRHDDKAKHAAEQQVADYCMAWLKQHPGQRSIFAMLAIGTEAKVWTVKKKESWETGWVDARDSDTEILTKAFDKSWADIDVNAD